MSVNYNDLLITYCSSNNLEKLKELFNWAESNASSKYYFRSWETPTYKYPNTYTLNYNDAIAYSCAKDSLECFDWLFNNEKFSKRTNHTFEALMNGGFKNAFVNDNKKIMDYIVNNQKNEKNKNGKYSLDFNEHFKYACKKCPVNIVEYIFSVSHISLSAINEGFISSCENNKLDVAKWIQKIYLPLNLVIKNDKIIKYNINENIYDRYELLLKNNVIIYKLEEKTNCVCCNKKNNNVLQISCGHFYCTSCFHKSKADACKKCKLNIHKYHFKYFELNPNGTQVNLNKNVTNSSTKQPFFLKFICGSTSNIDDPKLIKLGDYYIPNSNKVEISENNHESNTSINVTPNITPLIGTPPNISSTSIPLPSAPPYVNNANVTTPIASAPPLIPSNNSNVSAVPNIPVTAGNTKNETSIVSEILDLDDPKSC